MLRLCSCLLVLAVSTSVFADDSAVAPRAFVDGAGPGWKPLTLADFENVNCEPDTWSEADGVIHCTGQPIGVIRSKDRYQNHELVVEWRHLEAGGNSGVFLWATDKALSNLKPGDLPPGGIEIQILDPEAPAIFESKTGRQSKGLFTGHGDVFSVGESKIKAFEPASANGQRSFPRKELTKGVGEWNHYYIRAINGDVRLWVNGEEVSGGTEATPAEGFLCLESEGAPVEFRNLRLRVLP